jgi:hypothetical protein
MNTAVLERKQVLNSVCKPLTSEEKMLKKAKEKTLAGVKILNLAHIGDGPANIKEDLSVAKSLTEKGFLVEHKTGWQLKG